MGLDEDRYVTDVKRYSKILHKSLTEMEIFHV